MRRRNLGRLLLAASIPLVPWSCAKSTAATAPQTGRITVGVATRGSSGEIGAMEFVVEIQPGGTSARIRADGGVYDEDVPTGDYLVRLSRLPSRCHMNGAAERRVRVTANQTTAIRFSVTCD